MARIRVYIAASLDGYVATADGGVGWLEPFGAVDYGYGEFVSEIRTIVMGRVTFAHVLALGQWPYAGKRVFVWSHDPPNLVLPEGAGWTSDTPEALAAHLRRRDDGDVWLLGGPRTIASLAAVNAVDEWELFVMPVLLGDGVPLWPQRRLVGDLTLADATRYENGVMRLIYRPG